MLRRSYEALRNLLLLWVSVNWAWATSLPGQMPLQTGDLTNPSNANNQTDPAVQNPGALAPAAGAEAEAARMKLCAAAMAAQPPGMDFYCWIRAKMLLANACAGLRNKVQPLPGPGGAGAGNGEVMTGGVTNPGGEPQVARTVVDNRDPSTGTGSYTVDPGNLIVLGNQYVDPATGSCGVPGGVPAAPGTAVNQRLLATILFHEYCHCIEDSNGNPCRELWNHSFIHYMTSMVSDILDTTCPPPAFGTPGFGMWRELKVAATMGRMTCAGLAKQLQWNQL